MKPTHLLIHLLLIFTVTLKSQLHDPVKWTYEVQKIDNNAVIKFIATIDEGWNMYGKNIAEGGPVATQFLFTENSNYALSGDIKQVTKPKVKYDDIFEMDIEYHKHHAVFEQHIDILSENSFNIEASVEYMCCDDNSCLPPTDNTFIIEIGMGGGQTEKTVSPAQGNETKPGFNFETIDAGTNSINTTETRLTNTNTEVTAENTTKHQQESSDKSLLLFFLSSMFWGLLGVFTPCVYPMIPMTVSFFMRSSESKGKGIGNALFFGFSIVAIYTLIGVLTAIFKSNFINDVVTHWVTNLVFFTLFLTFAISFFGAFEIVLPSKFTNKIDQKADKAGFMGPFFMALATALVSFSCTGPLFGKVIVDALEGDVLKPVIGMFGFGLVFSLPFTLFAIFPSMMKGLPQSGGWLNSVKVVIGVLVLFFGMKFLLNVEKGLLLADIITTHFLSRELYLAIWTALFALLGYYLLGKFRLPHDSALEKITVFRFFLVITSFSFALYILSGFIGNPLKSLSTMLPEERLSESLFAPGTKGSVMHADDNYSYLCNLPSYADKLHLPYGLQGYFDYTEGLACAKEQNKPLLLDFKGHFCANCKDMEARVWSDPRVLKKLQTDFVIVAFFTDDRTKLPEDKWYTSALDGKEKKTLGKQHADFQATRFNTNTIPLYAAVDHNGTLLTETPFGYNPSVDDFLAYLEEAESRFKEN